MKKVGIVGGLGPASTIDYYRDINENFRKINGDDVYPEIVIDSINMHDLIAAIENNDYDEVARQLIKSINNLEKAGADFAVIASNTPHIAWNLIKDKVNIPLISIIEATCDYITGKNYRTVLVFGTKFTMRGGLYSKPLAERGIAAIVPSENDIEKLGGIIYPNLENGIVIAEDKKTMIEIAEKYIKQYNADALMLGCTEIPLMIKEGDVSVPVINTVQVHVAAVGKWLMSK